MKKEIRTGQFPSLPTIVQKNVVNKNLNPDESAVDLIRFSTTEKQKYFSYLGLK